jgi:hypothetical protein
LLEIVTYSYLIIPLCFFLSKGKIKDRVLFFLVLYGIAFFGLLNFYYFIPKDTRKYYHAFYTFIEYSFFTYIFWYNIQKRIFKSFMLLISILFILFQIFYVTTTVLKRLDSIPIGIETIFIFIYIFYFFYEYSKNIKDSFIYNHYCFWIAVGILIYLGGSFFFYLSINHLDPADIAKYGNLTYVAEILKNILFAISIFFYSRFHVNRVQNKIQKLPNLDMTL